jgi:hypothetical protein
MSSSASHRLLQWNWHHFGPVAQRENYLPILQVLGKHEGEAVKDAREAVNEEVHGLRLEVGLGKRKEEPYADIFRDRIDVWRFTGSLAEPGLVDEEIRLTKLGRALLDGSAPFDAAMARQALRLSFPRIPRLRHKTRLPDAVGELDEALALGPGVNVARCWSLAAGQLREAGEGGGIDGDEAAKFLSGASSLLDIPRRVEALQLERNGTPSGFAEVEPDKKRQGREIERWLLANGALTPDGRRTFSLDPAEREFEFADGSVAEMERWAQWWGSWPPPPA